jgi:CRP/FNR family transcriptional regulator, cyclic AMP receptor protein
MTTIQVFLKTVPVFRDLTDDDLAQILMVGMVRRFAANTVIISEGSPGGQLHVIHEGQVRISKVVPNVGEEALTILQPGAFFGEIEFFDGAPASAHAIAHTDCSVLAVPHEEMRDFIQNRPNLAAKFFWAFGITLASRLRDTNDRMATLLAISKGF